MGRRAVRPAAVRADRSGERLLDVARRTPGASVADVVRASGLARGTVEYHLRRLESSRRLEVRAVAGRRALFPAGPDGDAVAAALVRGDPVRRVLLERLAEAPRQRLVDLARHVGGSRHVLRRHLEHLCGAGLVARGRGAFEATGLGRRALLSLVLESAEQATTA